MRLAEAIMLGSTIIRPKPHRRHWSDGFGCAIGMAEIASGARLQDEMYAIPVFAADAPHPMRADVQHVAENLFPWAAELKPGLVCHICGMQMTTALAWRSANTISLIEHVFDVHVMSVYGSPLHETLEGLCRFIDSIDPTPREETTTEEEACPRPNELPSESLQEVCTS